MSSFGNEGFTFDLFDNSVHNTASLFRPSPVSTVRVEHDPAGMLAINLPPSSCCSIQFGFVGIHPGESLEVSKSKIHSSFKYQSREEKDSVKDDECVKETHKLLREVHQAIFDEQVEIFKPLPSLYLYFSLMVLF